MAVRSIGGKVPEPDSWDHAVDLVAERRWQRNPFPAGEANAAQGQCRRC